MENDVSASKHHLNERAEERKEEEEQIARCGETRAAAAATAADAAAVAAGAAAAADIAVADANGKLTADDGTSNVSNLKNGDIVGRVAAADATTTISAAPAAAAAAPGQENRNHAQGEGAGTAPEADERQAVVEKQTSMIQADRTDGENWDAKEGLGKKSGGCCSWRWWRRSSKQRS